MDADRWKKISSLFHEANELDTEAREKFLVESCADDAELRREVEALLDVSTKAASGIDKVVESAAAEYVDRLSEGQRIGPYRLLSVIARGGMGQVFLAERADEEFERRVAVKTISWIDVTPELIERFRTERQILADLEHPNIAHLLDGGETEGGIPYLVMEYIDGQPIDQYCDANRLSVQRRLKLFQKICSAVDYAHRKLIVHRDIKPSNILVTADGEPKLLDFGIAKLLDAGAARQAAVTRDGASIMTPEYASPEQVRAEPVSTATDIYSMGVLLYKLLCGRMPYKQQAMNTDLARAIQSDIPSRPSDALISRTRLHGDSDSIDAISSARKTSINRLRRRLRGDIDNVVLKALSKEPERRYPSASALSADIENVLTFRPVAARPASFIYLSNRFMRRYRVGVAIGMAVSAILVASVIQVVHQRDKARTAAFQSEQVVSFLGELFVSASSLRVRGNEITAGDLLEAGVKDVEVLDDQPQVQARLLEIMGTSYQYIGNLEKVAELKQRALDIRQNRLPYDAAAIGTTLRELSEVARLTGDFEKAEKQLRQSIDLYIDAHGTEHGNVAYAISRLGEVLRMSGRKMEAVEALERAATMKERLGETTDEEAIDIYGNLAIALDDVGRLDEAESINRKTVAASRLLTGDMDPNTLTRIGNLGLIQLRQGDYAEAQKNIEEAYVGINRIWLSDSTSKAWVAGIKGSVMSDLGRFDEALVALKEHRQVTANIYGKATLRYARALQKLGRWHLTLGNYQEARELLQQALATAADIGEDQSRGAGSIRLALVTLHNATGEIRIAEEIARRTLSAADSLARGTWIGLQRELARSLSKQGRYDEADPLFAASLEARELFSGKTNVSLLPILLAMSKHYRRTNATEQALSVAERAHKIGLAVTPPGSWEPAFASAEYAITLLASADPEMAQSLFDKAINDLIAAFGAGNPRIAALHEEFATAIR